MIGKTVGHYRITARLGAGGMGEVFLAEDARLERKAAIKFLPVEVADDPERRQRFLTEAKAASALNHPHVCVVYELASGQRTFTGASFAEFVNRIVNFQPPALARVNYDVSPEFERITLKCLQKQPDRRYQSARDLMVDLKNLLRESDGDHDHH